MQRLRILIATIALVPLALPGLSRGEEAQAPPAAAPAAVLAGDKVPSLKLKALFPGDKEPKALDLGVSLGRKPVVICYIVLGESLGEEGFLSVQKLIRDQLKAKVDFFGATRLGKKVTLPMAVERI